MPTASAPSAEVLVEDVRAQAKATIDHGRDLTTNTASITSGSDLVWTSACFLRCGRPWFGHEEAVYAVAQRDSGVFRRDNPLRHKFFMDVTSRRRFTNSPRQVVSQS